VGLGTAEWAVPRQREPGSTRILHLHLPDTFPKYRWEEELLELSATIHFDLFLTNAQTSDMI